MVRKAMLIVMITKRSRSLWTPRVRGGRLRGDENSLCYAHFGFDRHV